MTSQDVFAIRSADARQRGHQERKRSGGMVSNYLVGLDHHLCVVLVKDVGRN